MGPKPCHTTSLTFENYSFMTSAGCAHYQASELRIGRLSTLEETAEMGTAAGLACAFVLPFFI